MTRHCIEGVQREEEAGVLMEENAKRVQRGEEVE